MIKAFRLTPALAALGVLLIAGASLAGPSSGSEEKEKELVRSMVRWAELRGEARKNPGLEPDAKKAAARERRSSAVRGFMLLMSLRPDLADPVPSNRAEAFAHLLRLTKKYQPQREPLLRSEIRLFQVEQTVRMLKMLRRALENYRRGENEYPTSGNLRFSKAISPEHVRLPKYYYDERGGILDLWGRPLIYIRLNPDVYVLYSTGPDREDEQGRGDDVIIRK